MFFENGKTTLKLRYTRALISIGPPLKYFLQRYLANAKHSTNFHCKIAEKWKSFLS